MHNQIQINIPGENKKKHIQIENILEVKDNQELYTFFYSLYSNRQNNFIITAFCPCCGDDRRMNMIMQTSDNAAYNKPLKIGAPYDINKTTVNRKESVSNTSFPIILNLECMQCEKHIIVVIYKFNDELKKVFLYDNYAGAGTPHTPQGIKYYLNQAFLCKSIGAYSASVAMYRSALDWLMELNGYAKGMLGKRIDDMVNDIKSNNTKAPKWIFEIPPEMLDGIKKLGNESIHPNKGDLKIQEKMDLNLIHNIDLAFKIILEVAYEHPIRLEKLRKKFSK